MAWRFIISIAAAIPLAGHVPEPHDEAAVLGGDEVEVVASHVEGGDVPARRLDAPLAHRLRREQVLLHRGRAAELLGEALAPLDGLVLLGLAHFHRRQVGDEREEAEVPLLERRRGRHVVDVEEPEHVVVVPERRAHRRMDPLLDDALLLAEACRSARPR